MKNRFFFCIMLLFVLELFGNDIETYNAKAMEIYRKEPSVSIYYADSAIDLNSGSQDKIGLITSLHVKSLSYYVLDEEKAALNFANICSSSNEKWNYIYTNGDFYIYYLDLLLSTENYEKAMDILVNKNIINLLSEKEIIDFKIMQIRLDLLRGVEVSLTEFQPLIQGLKSLGYKDLLAKVYILNGDLLEKPQDKIRMYNSVIGLNSIKEEVIALKKIALVYREMGSLLTSLDFLKNAYLTVQVTEDNKLILEIINELAQGYSLVSDYRGLSDILKQKIEYIDIISSFYIAEHKKINNRDFTVANLTEELQEKEFLTEILSVTLITLSIVLIFTIVIISIQSYRIRKYSIGTH